MRAATQAGSVGIPSGACAISPIRSIPGGVPVCSAKGRAGAGALYQASGSTAAIASSTTAESATVRETTPSTTAPSQLCARRGTRPRLGFRPDEPAVGGGDADRAAAVVGVRDREHARRHRRRGAAA